MKKSISIILVNLITMVRIIGVFSLLPIYLNYGGVAAAVLSITCYLTDVIDGMLARKKEVSTFFGSMFDGIADKLFTIANLIVLVTITKYAIIPILFEVGIVVIQYIKYSNNINVQSSKIGKIKTWIIGITVIVLYLVTDISSLSFLNNSFIYKIETMNQNTLLGIIFIPLYLFEILTLISYLKVEKLPKRPELEKIDIKLKKVHNFKDSFDNFCTIWLNHDFYIKYKDCAELKTIRKYLKNNR